MKRRGIQLSPRHKRCLYSICVLLFASGATWTFSGPAAEDRGEVARLFRSWSPKLHGAAAMGFLIVLGVLIPTHIRRAWHARRNRGNGAFFLVVVATLVATGYGLYYFGDENWRSAAGWTHRVLGFASPALLALHIWQGRRESSR